MDQEYKFTLDKEKDILNQQYRIETKALFLELYEKYLAPKEERELWNKYDKICNNMIEDEKRIKYDTEKIFKNKKIKKEETIIDRNENDGDYPIEVKNKNVFIRFFNFMKKVILRKQ